MEEKTQAIYIRISQKEKEKLQRKARKSGLSLSSYLRKTGLEKEIYWVPDKAFYEIYLQISKLKNNVYELKTEDIKVTLERIMFNFLDIYNSTIDEDIDYGDN